MPWPSLRLQSLSRDVTNHPSTVISRSAPRIPRSRILQASVHGRRERVQIIFQSMCQEQREELKGGTNHWITAED